MNSAIDQFLTHVELELGLAHNTVLAYRADLADFEGFCEQSQTSLAAATPDTVSLYLRHLQNLYGAGGVDNPDGSRSSLYTMNVQMDDGRSYNIPSVYNGQILPPDRSVVDTRPSAIGNALALGLNNFPSYPSGFAAENRYQQMHNYMDRDTGAYFRSRR